MKKDSIMKMLEIMGLHRIIKILNESAGSCLEFRSIPTCEDALAVGTSKVGGDPDLPTSIQWPMWKKRYLDFLLQLNLVEMPQDLRCDLLPKSGRLYFFYDMRSRAWGFDPRDKGRWKVIFFQGNRDALVRTGKPGTRGRDPYRACRVEFYEALPPEWALVRDHPELKDHPDEVSKFDSLLAALSGIAGHRIMGYPDPMQSSAVAMQRKCQFVSHGLYMGGGGGPAFDEAKAKQLESGSQDWRLLLQLGSDSDAHMEWGDRGRLYFWIREQNLRAKNFEDVWMILECF